MDDKVPIDELIVKLSPNTYEKVLKTCIESYKNESVSILDTLCNVLLHIPGSFIHLTLIYDISVKNKDIAEDLKNHISQNIKTLTNCSFMINILFNIFYLEKLHFYKQNELEKLTTKNNLTSLYSIVNTSEEYKKIMYLLKFNENEYLNYEIEEIHLDENMIKDICEFCEAYNAQKQNFENLNGDYVIAMQLLQTFRFNVNDCKFFLVNYFAHQNFTQLVYALFLQYKKNDCSFFLCLFLELAKFENFLHIFYDLFYNLKDNFRSTNNNDALFFVNLVMALLYERFYFPTNETYSAYKVTCAYDPMYSQPEKANYMALIDAEIVKLMTCFSQRDYLMKNLPSRLHQYIVKEKEFGEVNNELKTYIKNKEDDKIKQMTKEQFFNSFFSISRHSISHFLSYLEILQDHFVLTKEEQEMFCKMFLDRFDTHCSYKKFVARKLKQFDVISEDVQKKYVDLFQ
ncbi:hypothetical protein BDAP_000226 [Binucleata daphniae]